MLRSVPHEKRRRVARKQMHSTSPSMPRAATRTSERAYWAVLSARFERYQYMRVCVQIQKMGERESQPFLRRHRSTTADRDAMPLASSSTLEINQEQQQHKDNGYYRRSRSLLDLDSVQVVKRGCDVPPRLSALPSDDTTRRFNSA